MPHRQNYDVVDEKAKDNRGRGEQDIVEKADHKSQSAMAAIFPR